MLPKLVRITTIPLSLEKLLEGQLTFMNEFYEVIAISAEKERLESYGRENGVKTFHVEMTREITPQTDLKALFRLYRYFRKTKPEIVHTHTPKAGIVGMMAAKMAGVPVRLHTVAGLPLLETTGPKRKLLDQVEKLTYRCATKVLPNSEGLKSIILKNGLVAESKLQVLGKGSSNGIDTKYFDPSNYSPEAAKERRMKIGIPQEDIVFIFVGRLVADKGINELVQAFCHLQKEKNNISLLLVGPFEQNLDPIKQENLDLVLTHTKIYTTGYQTDVRPYFALSDVLVFPSYREGFPNVVLQAGAMSIPSIVSNINGCNEIVVDGVNGIIIPSKDQNSLITAMGTLAANSQLRKEMGIRSRNNISKNYERQAYWNSLLTEYKKLESEVLNS